MASKTAENAVRQYLAAVKDPASLRDDESVADLRQRLESSDDAVERLGLRQQLIEQESPSVDRFEESFVTHAKAWADEQGITVKAFQEEGVPPGVLRRAGFSVGGRGRRGRQSSARTGTRKSRVTSEQVRESIPEGTFTIKRLQEDSGASPAVVRKVVQEEEREGRLQSAGTDPDHRGPGRAPILYRRAS